MKDRYTGKSRGFGFVSFQDTGAAHRALAVEHSIDGRRCEAKIALPKVRFWQWAGSPDGGLRFGASGTAPSATCAPSPPSPPADNKT